MPGAQTLALESKADILLYGGAAGGGKTDLLLGTARYYHHRSIIFRRVYPSLRGIVDRSRIIYNPDGLAHRDDSFNESLFRWKFHDGVQIRFASIQHDKNVTDHQGQPYDLHGFDEITEFSEYQFRFVTGWNRTTRPGQRCRIICTCNPPTNAEGDWIIRYWAPWIDSKHPNPALPGELRWFTTIDGKDVELPDGNPINHNGEMLYPQSRTFIPARLKDNPYLMSGGYLANLQARPEPLRSMLLYGDFSASREDDPWQILPTAWVDAAMMRWRERQKPTTPLSALGVDIARGGRDKTIISPRYGNYFAEQICYPGSATPDGPKIAGLVQLALNGCVTARVNVDVIGVGSSPYDFIKGFHEKTYALNSSEGTDARDNSGQLGFMNCRAEWWWKLREALDPSSGQDLAIPDDSELRADLTATKWEPTARGIKARSKKEVTEALGRSPDKGDSLVYAHAMPYDVGDSMLEAYAMKDAMAAKK